MPTPGHYGLWSLARTSWQPDPDKMDGTPIEYETVIEAIRAIGTYHRSFRLVPVRFDDDEGPNMDDLRALDD